MRIIKTKLYTNTNLARLCLRQEWSFWITFFRWYLGPLHNESVISGFSSCCSVHFELDFGLWLHESVDGVDSVVGVVAALDLMKYI
jgi:hypothetical protein